MNKKLLILPILLLIPQITHSWFWDQSVEDYLEQEYDYTETRHAKSEVNGETVRRIAQQELERILKPGQQNSSNKREVQNYISKASTEIRDTIMRMSVLSQEKANELAAILAHNYNYGPEFLGAKSAKMTQSKINRAMPVNAKWLAAKGLTKRDIVKDVSNTIKKQAKQELARKKTLYVLVGSLETRIDNELERIYRPYLDDYHSSKPTTITDEIDELYPQTSSSLNTYHSNIAKLKEYREDSCCVMGEEFGKGVKRINLLCGHTICVNCLYQWMNSGRPNAHTCPICRASIKNADFPSSFLEKHLH